MKKFILLLLLLFVVKVNAYENDVFTIEIPEGYKIVTESDDTYKWEKDNSYISINVESNNTKKYNVKSFSDEEIKKQSEYIEKGVNERLKKYNLEAKVSDSKRVNNSLEYSVYFPSKKLTGYDMYQIGRMYTTQKYITNVVYSNDKEIKEDDIYYKFIDTLKINDEEIKPGDTSIKDNHITRIIVIGVILGILGFVLDVIKKRMK